MLDFDGYAPYPAKNVDASELAVLTGVGALFLWEGVITTITEQGLIKAGGAVRLAAHVRTLAADVHVHLMFYTSVPPNGGTTPQQRTNQEVMSECYLALGRDFARELDRVGHLPSPRWWLKHVRDTLAVFME